MKRTFKRFIGVMLVAVMILANVFSAIAAEGTDFYVAGEEALCGVNWDPGAAQNKMTYNDATGLYEKEYQNVPAGTYQFKVTVGDWNTSYGDNGNNMKCTLAEAGDLLITFNASTDEVKWSSDAAGVTEAQYRVAGVSELCGSAWNASDDNNLMTWNADSNRWEKVYTNVAAGTYTFKVTKDGSVWIPDGTGNDSSVTVEEDGSTVTVYYVEGASAGAAEVTVPEEEVEPLNIKIHYSRADQDYTGWNVFTWSGSATAFEAEGEDGVVATIIPNDGVTEVGYIVRYSTSDNEWADREQSNGNDGNRYVDINGYAAGTIHVYVESGVTTETIDYSNAVEGEKVVDKYRVAGASELCGSVWDATDDNNLMTYNDTTKRYEKTYTGVAAGKYEFKVVLNGATWYPGGDNASVTVEEDGTHVIVWYDAETQTVGADLNTGLVINFYYNRADGEYGNWGLWLWDNVGTNAIDPYPVFAADANGKMVITYSVAPHATQVGFIVRNADWGKDPADGDRWLDVSQYVGGTLNVYLESGTFAWTEDNSNVVKGAKIVSAVSDGADIIKVTTSLPVDNYAEAFNVFCMDTEVTVVSVEKSTEENVYLVKLSEEVNLEKKYTIEFNECVYDVSLPSLYKSESFLENYTYTGDDLGATWSKESTTFKVWAPLASEVTLNLYENGKDGVKSDGDTSVAMTKGDYGVWSVTVEGDLNGTFYTYTTNNAGDINESCDPYAQTTGVNGDRAMVIDMSSTNPEGWEDDKNPNADLGMTDVVLYELHVRDASIDASSGVNEENKGNYLGLVESGTTTEGGTATVLDHMVDLGVTHVHLLPVYDINSVDEETDGYNWGYDPKNYNVPEGSYSSNPYDGYTRVEEFKQMVQGLHNNDISVVMDVVYNHVADAGNFCFNEIVPNYFSRMLENGGYSSNSGCGNDTATEHVMVRKYIVDSINYWAEEYHIDGFRFDLVGLIDVDTINEIMETVWEEHPDVIFYGEGWSMNSYDTGVEMTTQPNSTLVNGQANNDNNNGFAFFNDTFRNAIKGSVFDLGTGYISGATGLEETIEECFIGLAGGWCTTPTQTINYNSCHDNYTLYDRILLSRKDASEEDIIKMNNLAAAINFTSQGVPFIQAGEEFLRSKPDESKDTGYNENSYASGDAINSIKWYTLDEAEEADTNEYYKGLIAFRKAHAALRMTTAEEVTTYIEAQDGLDANVTAFYIDGEANGEEAEALFVIFNPNAEATTVALPEGEWNIYINGEEAGTEVLGTATGEVTVEGISAMVLVLEEDDDNTDVPGDDDNTDTPGTGETDKSPVTGDNTTVVLWVALIAVAAVLVVVSRKTKRA